MSFYSKVIQVLLLLLPLPICAQDEVGIRQQIARGAASVKTLQCDFVQTKHLKMLSEALESRGRMYYRQAAQLRWEYTSPYTYTFILNGDRVLLRNSQRSDVIDTRQNSVFREIARLMLGSMTGQSLADDKTFHTTFTMRDGQWVATLVPQRKDLRQLFKKMLLYGTTVVRRVELTEKNGDTTVIELKNIRTNENISADMFTVR